LTWQTGQSFLTYTLRKVISLIYGGDFNNFQPRTVAYGDEEYGLEILKRQFQYFGPFPTKYEKIASPMTVAAIIWLMDKISPSQMIPFANTTESEVCQRDKEFLCRIMKMDWRDRPTAGQLLGDSWFEENDVSDDH
jgi:hypothetical protein